MWPYDTWISHSAIFWGAVVLIVFVVSLFRYLNRASKHRMLATLAEKGQQITPELIDRIEHMKHQRDR